MLPFSEVNLIAVVVAFIANVAIGFTWYSPKVFGNRWMKLVGMSPDDKGGMGKAMTIGFSASFVRVFILALLLAMLSPATMSDAVLLGVLVWIGFIVTYDLDGVAWAKVPIELFWINVGMAGVGMVAASAIIFAMG